MVNITSIYAANVNAYDSNCKTVLLSHVLDLSATTSGTTVSLPKSSPLSYLCYSSDWRNPTLNGLRLEVQNLSDVGSGSMATVVLSYGSFSIDVQLQQWQMKTVVLGRNMKQDVNNKRTYEPYFNNIQYDGQNIRGVKAWLNVRLQSNTNLYDARYTDSWMSVAADIGGLSGLLLASKCSLLPSLPSLFSFPSSFLPCLLPLMLLLLAAFCVSCGWLKLRLSCSLVCLLKISRTHSFAVRLYSSLFFDSSSSMDQSSRWLVYVSPTIKKSRNEKTVLPPSTKTKR